MMWSMTKKTKTIAYDFWQYVASDVGIGQKNLPPVTLRSQSTNENISKWTYENEMKIHEDNLKFMIFSNFRSGVATRLKIYEKHMKKTNEIIHLGV